MIEKITNKRFKLFIKKLGYTEEEYFKKRKDINFSLKYIFFTNHMAQNYSKNKKIRQIYDFREFDNYCINYLNEIDELKDSD